MEYVVIGAGVVGLAVARRLARAGGEVLVLEGSSVIGSGTSSRNSEVIHAGIYYPQRSLKATLCVRGREQLYDFCKTRNVPHKRCGKIIVAANESQSEQIASIQKQAQANGVGDIESLDIDRLREMEPELVGVSALYSPSTGIVDSHALMLSMQGEAEYAGAQFAYRAHVRSIKRDERASQTLLLDVGDSSDSMTIKTRAVINAAGLGATTLAQSVCGFAPDLLPESRYAKGCYFKLAGKAPFERLIYPVPEVGGLGIHLTLDLQGNARFGPDVTWVDEEEYSVPESKKETFVNNIKSYWPGISGRSLQPDYAGIRPKVAFGGDIHQDFIIQTPSQHGVAGLVNLLGIESPGLTASFAIADRVADIFLKHKVEQELIL